MVYFERGFDYHPNINENWDYVKLLLKIIGFLIIFLILILFFYPSKWVFKLGKEAILMRNLIYFSGAIIFGITDSTIFLTSEGRLESLIETYLHNRQLTNLLTGLGTAVISLFIGSLSQEVIETIFGMNLHSHALHEAIGLMLGGGLIIGGFAIRSQGVLR